MTSRIYAGLEINHTTDKATIQYVYTNGVEVMEFAWIQWSKINYDKISKNLATCHLARDCTGIVYDEHQAPAELRDKLGKLPNVIPMHLSAVSEYNKMLKLTQHAKKLHMLRFEKKSKAADQAPFFGIRKAGDNYILTYNPEHPTDFIKAYVMAAYKALLDMDVIKLEELA